jgi:hypothetical protein
MPAVNKHFDAGAKRAAIELWRACMRILLISIFKTSHYVFIDF